MNIVWSPEAANDLEQLFEYIHEDSPEYAVSVYQRMMTQIENLIDQPHIGRPGRVAGTRELIITGASYIIPYRIKDRRVEIIRIYHTARIWPDNFN